MTYRAVLFDFFGVICPDVHKLWIKENGFAERMHELIDTYYQYSDIGSLSQSDLYTDLGKLVGRSATQVEAEINKFISIDPFVLQIIRTLHTKYKVGLCSNAPIGYVEGIMQQYHLGNDFDAVLISSAIHLRKPERAIFEKASGILHVEPQEIIFIDDNELNVSAAGDIGMKAFRFSTSAQLLSDLNLLGLDLQLES